MIPTMEMTKDSISRLEEDAYKKVAIYVQSLKDGESKASSEEVAALTQRFHATYSDAFKALSL